jgi:hypothetical protein
MRLDYELEKGLEHFRVMPLPTQQFYDGEGGFSGGGIALLFRNGKFYFAEAPNCFGSVIRP